MKHIKSIGIKETEDEGIRVDFNTKSQTLHFHGWCCHYEVEGFTMDLKDFCDVLGINGAKTNGR